MSPWYPATDGRPLGKVWRAEGVCMLKDCMRPWLGAERSPRYWFLCVEHGLEAAGVPEDRSDWPGAPVDDGELRRVFREGLRMSEADRAAMREALLHPAPKVVPTAITPLPAELLEAAMTTMRGLGAVPLRSEPTYGVPCGWGCSWRPPGKTPREYDKGRAVAWDDEVGTGLAGLEVDLDDEAVPSGARTLARAALKAAYAVRVVAGPETVILSARRSGVLVLVRYELGSAGWRFAAGWLRSGRGEPAPCTAKQVGTILRVAT